MAFYSTDIPKIDIRIPPRVKSISVVLPAHNEEENITKAALQALDILYKLPFKEYEVIIIDDGSSDDTALKVEKLKADNEHIRLIKHYRNLGYGGSLKSGLNAASGDLVFFTDADLQFDLNELPEFIEAIREYDIVIGYRLKRTEHLIRKFNAFGWGLLIRLLFGLKFKDIDCAFKLFRREFLSSIHINSIGPFINSEMLIRARDGGYRIKELPVSHYPRRAGKSSGAKPKTIIKAFAELFKLYRQLKQKNCPQEQSRAYSSYQL